MQELRRLLAQDEVVTGLRYLAASMESAFPRPLLETRLLGLGIAEPAEFVDLLLDSNLVVPYGPRLGLSAHGYRACLLAEALEGGDIEDIARRLRLATGQPQMYELVREGMTTAFIRSLVDKPGFRRLFICSPWISPSRKDVAVLRYAFYVALKMQKDPPEVLVILRPLEAAPEEAAGGVEALRAVGAQIYFNPRIHSKLYIREPDRRGGAPMAIVGSQNLTRSANLELGIRINGDTTLIDQLIRYFLEVASRSSETEPGEE